MAHFLTADDSPWETKFGKKLLLSVCSHIQWLLQTVQPSLWHLAGVDRFSKVLENKKNKLFLKGLVPFFE